MNRKMERERDDEKEDRIEIYCDISNGFSVYDFIFFYLAEFFRSLFPFSLLIGINFQSHGAARKGTFTLYCVSILTT